MYRAQNFPKICSVDRSLFSLAVQSMSVRPYGGKAR